MSTAFGTLRQNARSHLPSGKRGRYAPSPSGPLHLGNFRTALLAWMQAKLSGAALTLRIEDLDLPRMRHGSAESLMEELEWLGLTWDEGPNHPGPTGPYYQSERQSIYDSALAYLEAKGMVYRCYCSRKDILEASSAPHGHQGMPLYPGTCRNLTPIQEARILSQKPDRKPAWRIKAPDQIISFHDQLAGTFQQNLAHEVGDFVLKRSDGLFAYQLAVVVDDGLMGITDVVRGADLIDSTPRQIFLFQVLQLPIPDFWHVPLMCDSQGNRLAKRDGSMGLLPLRENGATANSIIGSLAASLGWVPQGSTISPYQLLETFCLSRFQSSLQFCSQVT